MRRSHQGEECSGVSKRRGGDRGKGGTGAHLQSAAPDLSASSMGRGSGGVKAEG